MKKVQDIFGDVSEKIHASSINDKVNELLHKKEEEEKKKNILLNVLAIIGIVAAIAAIAYCVVKLVVPVPEDDFDDFDFFEDGFDDDYIEYDDEKKED
ncbi:MAG: DUF4366 domain-containing protein [Lachnospiraceae bacterium]|nr:DUF4366 domain-containing protein [Lachnospiraceae bacterium]